MNDGPQAKAIAVADSRLAHLVYKLAHVLIRTILFRWFRLVRRGPASLDLEGPLIVAPVHRSNLDAPLVAALSQRRLRALAKVSLFHPAPLGWLMSALGGFPVERGTADRDALRAAQDLLDAGEAIFVFPEGTRQTGPDVAEVFDGAAFLAARTGARVVPVGIAGTEHAMPPGARLPRRTKVAVVVGDPLDPPTSTSGRVSLGQRRVFSAELRTVLQGLFDEAQAESEQV